MARTAVKLDEEEVVFFHLNYNYMWKKLNTAPYYVSGSGEIPKWIHDQWLLPSYVNLSKCLNITYVPSMNIVNKIVQFYNANIKPEVDTYAFLHEKLEASDNVRSTSTHTDTSRYCGLYNCYYYAGMANKKEVFGAVLKIVKVHDTTSVQMITGLTTDADMRTPQLMELFSAKDISLEKYKEYKGKLELAKRRTTLYKGVASLTPGMLTIQLSSEDRAGSMIHIRLPLVESVDGEYLGSSGLLTLLSEREVQILKMCTMRADIRGLKPVSLSDEQLASVLSIEKKENEHVVLSFADNSVWNDIILSQAE